jgi:bacteriocin-like protein
MRNALTTEPTETELSEEQLKQVSGGHYYRHFFHSPQTNTATNNSPAPIQDINTIIAGARVKF